MGAVEKSGCVAELYDRLCESMEESGLDSLSSLVPEMRTTCEFIAVILVY